MIHGKIGKCHFDAFPMLCYDSKQCVFTLSGMNAQQTHILSDCLRLRLEFCEAEWGGHCAHKYARTKRGGSFLPIGGKRDRIGGQGIFANRNVGMVFVVCMVLALLVEFV